MHRISLGVVLKHEASTSTVLNSSLKIFKAAERARVFLFSEIVKSRTSMHLKNLFRNLKFSFLTVHTIFF